MVNYNELSNDKDIVLAAIKNDPRAFEFAGSRMKNDKEVVLEAIKNDTGVLRYASESLQKDEDIKKLYGKTI